MYMTQSLDSDLPHTYVPRDLTVLLSPPPNLHGRPYMIALFMSGEVETSGRSAFVRELMQYLDVHSFGRMFHNRDIPEYARQQTTTSVKHAVISQYKFTLALENTIQDDYVTEKFYQPLIAGSIPVYLGAPNIAQFAPAPNSYIDVSTFRNTQQLAEYLQRVSKDKRMFDSYHSWRRNPGRVHERLQKLANMSAYTAAGYGEGVQYNAANEFDACRICEYFVSRTSDAT